MKVNQYKSERIMRGNKPKYAWEILLEKAPYSSELHMQIFDVDMCDEPKYWDNLSFSKVIAEVQEIANRYSVGSGWSHAEGIEDNCEGTKQELKQLKAVIRHIKRVYKTRKK